jgi:DNA primase
MQKLGVTAIGIADEVKSRVNIVDVIGRTVQLKKSGSRWLGLCPFHNEKTPSFFVNEDMQNFKCFGCGASGDVISYVERKFNLSFMEAAERLANEYGFELPKGSLDVDSRKTKYYDANRIAAAYFHNTMRQADNLGFKYMTGRGISPQTMTKFGIGYADERWDSLYEHLVKNGVAVDTAKELGLVSTGKDRNYDRYRSRVMFPIINTRSKVVGFGGRVINPEDNPKYLNSAESKVFQKKNNLYGINITRDYIKNEDYAILVEGYMDAVSLYQHGICNVVASLGTALTPNQGSLLRRYSENVIIAYDSDTAGQTATLRNIDVLRKAGCNIKVLNMGDIKDPDEYVKKYGREKFLEAIKKAEPFMGYKLSKIREKYDLDTEDGSIGFLKEASRTISELTPVETDFYIKRLAEDNDISEDAIRAEAYGNNRDPLIREKSGNPSDSTKEKREEDSRTEIIERNLIRLLIHDSGYLRRIQEENKNYKNIFKTPIYFRIYDTMSSMYKDDIEINLEKLVENLEGEDASIIDEIMESVPLGSEPTQQLEELLEEIEIMELDKREREILGILKEKSKEATDRTDELMGALKEIQRKKKHIKER